MIQIITKFGQIKTLTVSTSGVVSAILPIISSGGSSPEISTLMSSNKLIGRYSSGAGVMEEIILGAGLSLDGNILNSEGVSTYEGASPTTLTVGGLPVNTDILGQTYDQIIEQIVAPYVLPTFTSFSISGQSTLVESGNSITGSKSFIFTVSQLANISANTLAVFNGLTSLASSLPIVSPAVINVGTINLTGDNLSYTFQAKATNTQSVLFASPLFTVVSRYKQFYGNVSAFPTNSSTVRALTNSNFTNTNSWITPLVTTTKFSFSIPATKSIVSVITANFENITASFSLDTFNVGDFAGNLIPYKTYNYSSAIPLNLTLTITIA